MSSFTAVTARDALRPPPPDVTSAIPAPATRNDAEAEPGPSHPSSTRPRQMLRSGAVKAVNNAFLTMCNMYLGNNKPRTMQASAQAVIKRYEGGDLTAKQLADFMSAFYEAVSDHRDASQEQAAWLSSVERTKDHWKKLGYLEYEDYLAAIDPH